MKALLLYPEYPDTFWSFKTVLKYVSKKAAFPPLGLLTVGAMMPQEWETKLVDLNVRSLSTRVIDWADIVFVSGMIVQKGSAQAVIKRCKERGKTVVAGGPLFTTQFQDFSGVDHFVLNEAEVTLPRFLSDLQQGSPQRFYRSGERPGLSHTPIPAWHLIRFRDYVTMSVQYSRGCPFNCEFCDIVIMNGRVPRSKSPMQILTEIESLYAAGWRGGLFIVDDNFIGNNLEVKHMLRSLVQWQQEHQYPFQLFTEASVNLADDLELMQLMSAANFHKVFLGIETSDDSCLKASGKYQNTKRDLIADVQAIQRQGMQVLGGFIVGFDADTASTFETQIRFIQEAGVVTAMVGVLTALPLTRLWERLRNEDRLLGETGGENTSTSINFMPKMGIDMLIQGYRKIIDDIYSRRLFYQRIQTFLQCYSPTVRARFTLLDLKALLKSMLWIGIFSSARYLYWELLLRTLWARKRSLPVVVELMILGEHFFKMRKRLLA